ncbi:pirin family protein [Hymenobacter sp.]|jgi:hypothetical protein|uniref:pirin family protein n=1 Tax=Hymenobacter sp. TaxID=1898978 RepID=UPI002ED7C640
MQTLLHTADSRGHASHGWLNSHHSFSFAGYNNPQRMHFGVLRVLNDDTVAGGMGFGTHPHDNMEIISIPLSGTLEHKDSAGNHGIIQSGDVQVMSAGTGIAHSEKNHSKTEEVKFLQIWLFPNKRNVPSRYDQQTFRAEDRHNQFQQILSPNPDDAGVWIHQDAWFHLADFDANFSAEYQVKRAGNGVYVFVLEGDATVAGQTLHRRDGFGIWNTDSFTIQANSNTRLLLMDVPMEL